MKVLIITPSDHFFGFEYNHSGRENLGVEYLLSALRINGHEAFSYNYNLKNAGKLDDIDITKFEVIGFSLPFWECRNSYIDYINKISCRTSSIIIAGGHAATIGAQYFLSNLPQLEGIVMGEGEETLIELLENNKFSTRIPGFFTRNHYKPRRLQDIDQLSFPDRDELSIYLTSKHSIPETYVSSTRGCTNSCNFCSIPTYYKYSHGKKWRERSAQNVCSEIVQIVNDFPEVGLLSFTDDNFLGFSKAHHRRAIEISECINSTKNDLLFEIACRSDCVIFETFNELSQNGLSGVYLGIESGSEKVLDKFNKKTTVKQNMHAIEILSKLGVGCDIGFIMFAEEMDFDDVNNNYLFLKHIVDNYDVFVHPATLFRSQRKYPNDLGSAAMKGQDYNVIEFGDPRINELKHALELLWQHRYQDMFLKNESLAYSKISLTQNVEMSSIEITKEMLKISFEMIEALINFPAMNSFNIVKNYL